MIDATTTPAKRGPHAQRRAATRKLLLDAAVECLVDLGYSGTTTMEIQARAGVSRGALLHHFASRTDLLVAAVDHLFAARLTAMYEQSLTLPRTNRLDQAIDLLWENFQQPLSTAALELWVASRTYPDLATAIARNEPTLVAQALRRCDDLFGHDLVAKPGYVAFIATLLEAMVAAAMARHVRTPEVIELQVRHWKSLGHAVLGA